MAAKQLPPPITEGDARIKDRPYESDFARFPADEVHPRRNPGDGPVGGLDDGPRSWALLVFVVGFAIAFVTFFGEHWAPLVVGLALMLAGIVWGAVRGRSPKGARSGTGSVRLEPGG